MIKTSVYIATSLDGFIAREDGDIDWLSLVDSPTVDEKDQPDYGYYPFLASVDALVMGRNTYEKVLTFGDWPYQKPVIVLSRGDVAIADEISDRVESSSLEPQALVQSLAERGWSHLYIDGGQTIQRFLNAGLIDEMILSIIPVLIGRGIPLFGDVNADIVWQPIATEAFPSGLVQIKYRRLASSDSSP